MLKRLYAFLQELFCLWQKSKNKREFLSRSALGYKKELLATAESEAASRLAAVGETENESRQAETEIASAQAELEQLSAQAASAAGEEEKLKTAVGEIAKKRDATERRIADLRADIKSLQIKKEESFRSYTGLCGRADVLNGEYETVTNKLWDEYEMTYSAACEHRLPVEKMEKAPSRLASLKSQIRAMGSINANAVEEYKETKERFDFLTAQTEDLNKTRRSLDNAISRLNASMKTTFTECFDNINRVFGEVFTELFGGGSAHLELEDPETQAYNCFHIRQETLHRLDFYATLFRFSDIRMLLVLKLDYILSQSTLSYLFRTFV